MDKTSESMFDMYRGKKYEHQNFHQFWTFLWGSQCFVIFDPKQASKSNSKQGEMISTSSSTNPERFIEIGDTRVLCGTCKTQVTHRRFFNLWRMNLENSKRWNLKENDDRCAWRRSIIPESMRFNDSPVQILWIKYWSRTHGQKRPLLRSRCESNEKSCEFLYLDRSSEVSFCSWKSGLSFGGN